MASCAMTLYATGLQGTAIVSPQIPAVTVHRRILTQAPEATTGGFSIARFSVAGVAAAGLAAAGQARFSKPSQRKVMTAMCAKGGDDSMKVAYVFATNMSSTFKLAQMILPQIESGNHGAKVAGMMFFDDNIFCLKKGDPVGERLAKVAKENGMLLMACDQCAIRRNLANGTMEQCGSGEVTPKDLCDGVMVGCFPQLYAALGEAGVHQVISL
ncbi:unnamed protein product [Symbiodinium sp. CCMP2592]|nr:unnamed protein product [Symbiodinium sp. CCMP2592]